MTRLSNEQIMDFLDGTLSREESARIESHLLNSPEDRELVDELRFATQSLHDFNVAEYGDEPLRVSDNFWPHTTRQTRRRSQTRIFPRVVEVVQRRPALQNPLFVIRSAPRSRPWFWRWEC